jgi:integrase
MASIRKRKGKKGVTWFAEVRRTGHASQRQSFHNQADAKAWARQIEREMDQGKRHSSSAQTLGWLIDEFIGAKRLNTYQANMLEAWRERLGDSKISDLHREDFLEVRRALQKELATRGRNKGEPLTPSTINKRMAAISAVLTWGMDEYPKFVERNPARIAALKTDNQRNPLDAGWTPEIGEQLLAACQAHQCPTLYPFVLMAMATGARAGEIQKLRWSDIDLAGDIGVARFRDTKNDDSRGVPFKGRALEAMREWKRARRLVGVDLVFYNPATPQNLYSYRVHWGQVKAIVGVEDKFTFHDLRHVMASTAAMAGIPLNKIGETLGQRSAQMTKRYSHYSTESLNDIADLMAGKLGPGAKNV